MGGSQANGNHGCDPEDQLPTNEPTTVRLDMTAGGMEVFYNGESKCSEAGRDRTNFNNVQIYSSDPWHTAADATIQNLRIVGMDSEDVLVPGAVYFTASPFQLINADGSVGREMVNVDVPLDFDVSSSSTRRAPLAGGATSSTSLPTVATAATTASASLLSGSILAACASTSVTAPLPMATMAATRRTSCQ